MHGAQWERLLWTMPTGIWEERDRNIRTCRAARGGSPCTARSAGGRADHGGQREWRGMQYQNMRAAARARCAAGADHGGQREGVAVLRGHSGDPLRRRRAASRELRRAAGGGAKSRRRRRHRRRAGEEHAGDVGEGADGPAARACPGRPSGTQVSGAEFALHR